MLTLVVAASMIPPAAALPSPFFQFSTAQFENPTAAGDLAGIRFQADQPTGGSFQVQGSEIRVVWANYTARSVPLVGTEPQRAGDERVVRDARIEGRDQLEGLDVLVVATADATIQNQASRVSVQEATAGTIRETSYVSNTRPLLEASTLGAVQVTGGSSSTRISGSFAMSIWSWNITVANSSGSFDLFTGSYRTDVTRDPAGTEVTWINHVQVVQIFVSQGWAEFSGMEAASFASFVRDSTFEGTGTLALEAANGTLQTKPPTTVAAKPVTATGDYRMIVQPSSSGLQGTLLELRGSLSVDGTSVNLGTDGPVQGNAVTARQTTPAWTWALGILGLLAVAALIHGPARQSQFNRVQSRFESRDYVGVLRRIDPFTHRRKFQRRATFLKVVSLLSLQDYREAALYLQSLGPQESPEPATKAFLQACAAAGLGQDSTVIKLLSDCFRDQPSYIEEARNVPILRGYLPYFDVSSAEEAAT